MIHASATLAALLVAASAGWIIAGTISAHWPEVVRALRGKGGR